MKILELMWATHFLVVLSVAAVAQTTSGGYVADTVAPAEGEAKVIFGTDLHGSGIENTVGTASNSVTVEVDNKGNLVVKTQDFVVYLSSDGEFLGRTEVPAEGMIAALPAIVDPLSRATATKPLTTPGGAPLPPGGLASEEVIALSAALIVSSQRIEEARLMDKAVQYARDGMAHLALSDPEISTFLYERRGIAPQDTDSAVQSFIAEALERTVDRENRYEREWNRIIRESEFPDFVENRSVGPAEQIGRDFGPYLGNALYAAGGFVLAKKFNGELLFSTITGALGTPVGDTSASALGAYGGFIDKTGSNPFYFDLNGGNSPRPGKSILDSMREAFSKIFEEED